METLTIIFPKISGYKNSRGYYNYMSFDGTSISDLVWK